MSTSHEGHDTWPLISKPGTTWCRTCQEHYDAAGDSSLGVGHVWTNTACPAYRSYDPRDCICRQVTS